MSEARGCGGSKARAVAGTPAANPSIFDADPASDDGDGGAKAGVGLTATRMPVLPPLKVGGRSMSGQVESNRLHAVRTSAVGVIPDSPKNKHRGKGKKKDDKKRKKKEKEKEKDKKSNRGPLPLEARAAVANGGAGPAVLQEEHQVRAGGGKKEADVIGATNEDGGQLLECSECPHTQKEGKFCAECGAKLKMRQEPPLPEPDLQPPPATVCGSCGSDMVGKFCGDCGAQVAPVTKIAEVAEVAAVADLPLAARAMASSVGDEACCALCGSTFETPESLCRLCGVTQDEAKRESLEKVPAREFDPPATAATAAAAAATATTAAASESGSGSNDGGLAAAQETESLAEIQRLAEVATRKADAASMRAELLLEEAERVENEISATGAANPRKSEMLLVRAMEAADEADKHRADADSILSRADVLRHATSSKMAALAALTAGATQALRHASSSSVDSAQPDGYALLSDQSGKRSFNHPKPLILDSAVELNHSSSSLKTPVDLMSPGMGAPEIEVMTPMRVNARLPEDVTGRQFSDMSNFSILSEPPSVVGVSERDIRIQKMDSLDGEDALPLEMSINTAEDLKKALAAMPAKHSDGKKGLESVPEIAPAPAPAPNTVVTSSNPPTPAAPTELPPLKTCKPNDPPRSASTAATKTSATANAIDSPNKISASLPKPTIVAPSSLAACNTTTTPTPPPPKALASVAKISDPFQVPPPKKKRSSVILTDEEAAKVRSKARKYSLVEYGIEMRGVSLGFLEEFRADVAARHDWLQLQAQLRPVSPPTCADAGADTDLDPSSEPPTNIQARQKRRGSSFQIPSTSSMEGFNSVSTATVCQNICAAETKEKKVAYIDLFDDRVDEGGAPFVGKANVFVSHAWRYDALDVIDSILEAAPTILERRQADGIDELYFWFDTCVVCQHEDGEQRSQAWWADQFKDTIADIGYTLLILMPWDNPIPMTRAWCLWEMMATLASGIELHCQMPAPQRKAFIDSMIEHPGAVEAALNVLETVDARNATAWMPSDQKMIFAAIERNLGFSHLNRAIKDQMREWLVATAQAEETDMTATFELAAEGHIPFESLDPGHEEALARLQFNLGCLLNKLGKHADAREVLLRCLTVAEMDWTTVEKHHDLAAVNLTLGLNSAGQGNYKAAIEYYTRALKIHQQFNDLSEPRTSVVVLLLNFGVAAKSLKQLDQALKYFKQCTMLIEKIQATQNSNNAAAAAVAVAAAIDDSRLSEKSLDLLRADVYVNIGVVQNAQNRLAEAGESYKAAKAAYVDGIGTKNLQYARVEIYLGNLSKKHAVNCLKSRDRAGMDVACNEAMAAYNTALEIHEQILGHVHQDSAGIIRSLGNIYVFQNNVEKARGSLSLAINIYRQCGLSDESHVLAQTIKSLETIGGSAEQAAMKEATESTGVSSFVAE